MYINVDFCLFCDMFRNYNRDNNFSYEGKRALFDYITELEEYNEQEELDVIALCCDWSEDTQEAIKQNYNLTDDDNLIDYLDEHTQYIILDNGDILYLSF